MKKLVFLAVFICFVAGAKAQFTIVNTSTTSLIEPRTGAWPLDLQRIIKESDTCYVLSFRDQQYTNTVNMSTLRFATTVQLRYLQQALTILKKGHDGDVAKFKDFSVKRSEGKKDGLWYILTCASGEITNFQQPEADKMITAINSL